MVQMGQSYTTLTLFMNTPTQEGYLFICLFGNPKTKNGVYSLQYTPLNYNCFYLVEFKNIQEFKQSSVLLTVLQLDVVLLQTVQGQLSFVINIHLHRILQYIIYTTSSSARRRPWEKKLIFKKKMSILKKSSHIFVLNWVSFRDSNTK